MQAAEGHRAGRGRVEDRSAAEGYVKEFTRHSGDVLRNLNELRHRGILTDATLVVGAVSLRAHCSVLVACSGFFYSLFSRCSPAGRERPVSVSLPDSLDAASVSLLLDFMYTSRLPLSACTVPGVLAAATYLQMEHVADTCRAFMLNSERMSGPPQKELDSPSSAVSLAPPGGAFPNSLLSGRPTPYAATSHPPGGAAAHLCCDSARVPGESWASQDPGTRLDHEPRSERVKLEIESPTLGSPTPSPDSPTRSGCQPNSPAESSGCSKTPQPVVQNGTKSIPDPKACNWKKYKFIVLNPLCAATVKEEEPAEGEGPQHCSHVSATTDRLASTPKPPLEVWPMDGPDQDNRAGQGFHCDVSQNTLLQEACHGLLPRPADELTPLPTPLVQDKSAPCCSLCPHPCSTEPQAPHHNRHLRCLGDSLNSHPMKSESCCSPFRVSSTLGGAKSASTGDKPYRCSVCGAQFNRPANLKTHSRIHSGEKPYRCDTCGARFVQVAHLRAHVLIHTGEKPYPCHTCGTRFRHLQTLKSHLRIHTGEKPYTCEKCDLHFRHKSQLRLHLRQKHGAVTNTKIRYKVLVDPYRPVLQSC
ncbi:hypothetical protein MATL_G00167530 [Megalops atlanticus]|uniref:BCL6B transcription repressor n=1 Tax=Megalops atlanticus TaxID=7932 RepID=A0A9D3T6U7_MEGAT|nr:hypothetical protein MATL_G00167530 [Megalops atlanticus]